MNQLIKYRYYIGIDVGTKTGIAVWDRQSKSFTRLDTLKIHEAWALVTRINQGYVGMIFVRVEDARKISWETKDKKADAARAQGAGSVKRDAAIWEDFLTDMNIPFEMVKANNTKLPADKFEMITGYKEQTSSHARDAAMMVYGL